MIVLTFVINSIESNYIIKILLQKEMKNPFLSNQNIFSKFTKPVPTKTVSSVDPQPALNHNQHQFRPVSTYSKDHSQYSKPQSTFHQPQNLLKKYSTQSQPEDYNFTNNPIKSYHPKNEYPNNKYSNKYKQNEQFNKYSKNDYASTSIKPITSQKYVHEEEDYEQIPQNDDETVKISPLQLFNQTTKSELYPRHENKSMYVNNSQQQSHFTTFSQKNRPDIKNSEEFIDIKSIEGDLTKCLANSMHREEICKLLGITEPKQLRSPKRNIQERSESNQHKFEFGSSGSQNVLKKNEPKLQKFEQKIEKYNKPNIVMPQLQINQNINKPSQNKKNSPILKLMKFQQEYEKDNNNILQKSPINNFQIEDQDQFNFSEARSEQQQNYLDEFQQMDLIKNKANKIQQQSIKKVVIVSPKKKQPTKIQQEDLKLEIKGKLKNELNKLSNFNNRYNDSIKRNILTIHEKIQTRRYQLSQ